MSFKHFAVPLILLVGCLGMLLLATMIALCGCHDPLLEHIKSRYPNCEVLKVEDTSFGDQEVTIQCPLSAPKTIRVKRAR